MEKIKPWRPEINRKLQHKIKMKAVAENKTIQKTLTEILEKALKGV